MSLPQSTPNIPKLHNPFQVQKYISVLMMLTAMNKWTKNIEIPKIIREAFKKHLKFNQIKNGCRVALATENGVWISLWNLLAGPITGQNRNTKPLIYPTIKLHQHLVFCHMWAVVLFSVF